MKKALSLLTVVTTLVSPGTALAHYLWLEPVCEESRCDVKLFFGEYQEQVRETKSTRLLERAGVEGWVIGNEGKQTLSLEPRDDHFFGAAKAAPGSAVVAVDDEGPVVDYSKYGIGIVRPIFYARTHLGSGASSAGARSGALDLDIVPKSESATAKVGKPVSLALVFKGKPLTERADVRVYAPNTWSHEGRREGGDFSFTPLWPGLYVVEVIYREPVRGNFKGKRHEAIRHRATFTMSAGQ